MSAAAHSALSPSSASPRARVPKRRIAEHCIVDPGAFVPYLYIDKLLNELRDELLSALHSAVEREIRPGSKVDVSRLYRAFTRAAVGKMANPVRVSERCIDNTPTRTKKGAGRDAE